MAGKIVVSTLNNDTGVLATQNGMTGICKAWINFNGVSGSVAIRASFNVSSITRNGTGDYTITFTTSMPNANYSFTGVTGWTVAAPSAIVGTNTGSNFSTTSLRFYTLGNGSDALTDCSTVMVQVFSS